MNTSGAGTPRLVVVLSLGRSGSSLLARVLHEVLGIDFGEAVDHIPVNRTNPDGYFENSEVLKLNDEVLAAIGAGVFQPPPLDYFLRRGFDDHAARMRRVTEFYFTGRTIAGIKDPRLAFTLPVWRAACPALVPVIIFRNPGGAASSIVEQNAIGLDHALSLWYEYYRRIFHYTTGLPRFVTSFERLVASPAEVTGQLARHLDVCVNPAMAEEQLKRIVVAGQVKHSARAEPAHYSPFVDANTKVLYAYLDDVVGRGLQPEYHHLGSVLAGLRVFDEFAAERRQVAERKTAEQEGQLRSGRDTALARVAEQDRQVAALTAELARTRSAVETQEAEAAALTAELARTRSAVETQEAEAAALAAELARTRSAVETQEAEAAALTAELARERETVGAREMEITLSAERLEAATVQAKPVVDDLRARRAEVSELRGALDQAVEGRTRLAMKTVALAAEVEAYRARRVIRWVDGFKRRADLREWLNPAFRQLHDDSLLFTPQLREFVLRPSENLQMMDCLTYPLGPLPRRFRGVFLAPILTVPSPLGVLGIEVVEGERVIAESRVTFEQIDERMPTRFEFAPIGANGDEPTWLRVFVRETDHPVRIFEWQRLRRLPWRASEHRAFAGFLFSTDHREGDPGSTA